MILPLNYIIGILALIFLILTASIRHINPKLFRYHKLLGIITVILASIHAYLALRNFF